MEPAALGVGERGAAVRGGGRSGGEVGLLPAVGRGRGAMGWSGGQDGGGGEQQGDGGAVQAHRGPRMAGWVGAR